MEIGGSVRVETHNLRDLLRIKEDDRVNDSATSHAAGAGDSSSSSGLTLLALFGEKIERTTPANARANSSSRTLYDIIREERMSDGGNSWRQLTDKIRRYQEGRNLSSPEAVNDNPNPNPNYRETERVGGNRSEKERRMGAGEEYNVNSCCVCMVREKGAAFIPCGHTFCRECSRELWVQRGNCPICNNIILEILDIF